MAQNNEFTMFQQFLAKLPGEIAASFSGQQMSAIEATMGSLLGSSKHPVAMRMRFGMGSKRFYTVLLAGSEKRPEQRRTYETTPQVQAMAVGLALGLFFLQLTLLRYLF